MNSGIIERNSQQWSASAIVIKTVEKDRSRRAIQIVRNVVVAELSDQCEPVSARTMKLPFMGISYREIETANDLYRRTSDEIGVTAFELENTVNYLTTLSKTRSSNLVSELDSIQVSMGSWVSNRKASLREQLIVQIDRHPSIATKFQSAEAQFEMIGEVADALIEEATQIAVKSVWENQLKESK